MKSFKVQLVIFIAILVAILGMLMLRSSDMSDVQQAEEYYRKGETATTIYERTEAFNQALALFLQLDGRYHPKFGTGRLHYNIGNTYFQLGEYPFSILYYERAEKLMPRSESVKRNLSQATAKAGLKMDHPQSLFDLFLLKPFLSLPERLQLFAVFAILTLVFSSAWLWTRKPWLSKTAVVFLIPAFVLFLNLVVTYYFSPIEAVLVQAAELRRDVGEEFALVAEEPILGGTVVEVLGTSPNGRWLKVVVPSGDFGFMPSESMKLIE